jgi:hypothetical protein
MELLADGAAPGAEGQRMRLGERALALQARRHRRFEQLGELAELCPGFGVVHPLTGVDDRTAGGHERSRHVGHGLRVGRHAEPRRRRVRPAVGHLLAHHVDGDLDEHGPRPAVLDLGERAAHRIRDRLREHDLLGPLGDVLIVEEGAEVRRDVE